MDLLLGVLASALTALLLPAVATALERRGCPWILPFRGGWLLYLAAAVPAGALSAVAMRPAGLAIAGAALLATGWWGYRSRLLRSVAAQRFKAIDVGTGILIVAETGGPLPAGLDEELRDWQEAGLETLSRDGAAGGAG